jgi:hypothetical protein
VIAAAITGAALLLTGCSVLGSLTSKPSATPTPTKTTANVFTLKVGDCLDDASSSGTVVTAPVVPCSEPHDSEAYASIKVSGNTYPGKDAITTQADEGCAAAFPAFVGMSFDNSTLKISYYYPTQDSWTQKNDRQILCTVYDDGVKTTGTLKNADR